VLVRQSALFTRLPRAMSLFQPSLYLRTCMHAVRHTHSTYMCRYVRMLCGTHTTLMCKHIYRQTHIHTNTQTSRRATETHRQAQRHIDTETPRHRDTETQRHRDTDIHIRDTQTQIHRDKDTQNPLLSSSVIFWFIRMHAVRTGHSRRRHMRHWHTNT
jgi:hypothetical protein